MDGLQAAWSRLGLRRVPESAVNRLVGLALLLPTGLVLGIATWLHPDPSGVGTHRQLGLGGCIVLTLTGVPCPMCGMTTTFSLMAHGRPLTALLNQPFGVVLFSATVVACALGAYDLGTGRGTWRRVVNQVLRYETSVAAFILAGLCAGWIYKILVVRKILGHFLDGSGGGL